MVQCTGFVIIIVDSNIDNLQLLTVTCQILAVTNLAVHRMFLFVLFVKSFCHWVTNSLLIMII